MNRKTQKNRIKVSNKGTKNKDYLIFRIKNDLFFDGFKQKKGYFKMF